MAIKPGDHFFIDAKVEGIYPDGIELSVRGNGGITILVPPSTLINDGIIGFIQDYIDQKFAEQLAEIKKLLGA